MGKTNGNGKTAPAVEPLEGLRANVTRLQARARELDTAKAEAQAALAANISARPELAAAAHVRHEPAAMAELKALNLRVLDDEAAVLGLDTEAAKVAGELDAAEAALNRAELMQRLEAAEAEAAKFSNLAAAREAEAARLMEQVKAQRQAVRDADAQRSACIDTICDCLTELGGGVEGHPWPTVSGFDAQRRQWLPVADR